MTATSAYALFDASYGQKKPYITVTEYQNAPTAIDTANLIPSGSYLSQEQALAEVISRASSMLDAECMGAWGTLSATTNVENARIWGSTYGSFIVHPKYWPILEVSAFSYGLTPSTSAASVTPAGNVWIEPTQFVVQPGGVVGLGFGAPPGVGRGPYFCSWEYTNGWPNTTLSASVGAGAASVSPVDPTGIYPGTILEIFDAPNDEAVTVASTYTPGTSPVPLVSALASSHPVGATLSNLPTAAKQAAISMVTCLVKVRGSGALIADDIGEVRRVADANPQGAADDLAMAMRGIKSLRQMFVGY